MARKYARIFVRGYYLFRVGSLFSPQMEAIVFIILQILIATRAVLKIGEYSRIFPSFSWGILAHVACLDQSLASENIWWIINLDISFDFFQDWDEVILQKFLRNIKSINTRQNVDIYHIIVFPRPAKLMESTEFVPRTLKNGGLTCEIGYIHSLEASNKKGQGKTNGSSSHSRYSLKLNFRLKASTQNSNLESNLTPFHPLAMWYCLNS